MSSELRNMMETQATVRRNSIASLEARIVGVTSDVREKQTALKQEMDTVIEDIRNRMNSEIEAVRNKYLPMIQAVIPEDVNMLRSQLAIARSELENINKMISGLDKTYEKNGVPIGIPVVACGVDTVSVEPSLVSVANTPAKKVDRKLPSEALYATVLFVLNNEQNGMELKQIAQIMQNMGAIAAEKHAVNTMTNVLSTMAKNGLVEKVKHEGSFVYRIKDKSYIEQLRKMRSEINKVLKTAGRQMSVSEVLRAVRQQGLKIDEDECKTVLMGMSTKINREVKGNKVLFSVGN